MLRSKFETKSLLKIKCHPKKWHFIILHLIFLLVAFISWNYFGLLYVINILLLFRFIENSSNTSLIFYLLNSFLYNILFSFGAIGWLFFLEFGKVALLGISIVYLTPFLIVYYIKSHKVEYFILIWILCELLINNFSFPTPLLTIGNALANQIHIIQWYSYTSIIGGSIWMFLMGYFLNFSKKGNIKNILMFFIILVLPILFSLEIYYFSTSSPIKNNENYKITVFNPSFYQDSSNQNNLATYLNQKKDQFLNSELLIIPESSFQFNSINYKKNITYYKLKNITKKVNINIIAGTNLRIVDNTFINGALFINKNISYFKSKQKLIPYSENTPFFIRFLKGKDGVNIKNTSIENTIENLGFSTYICYDAFFPFYILNNSKNSNIIIVISSELFLKKSFYGKLQYKNIMKIRSIENRKPLLLCTENDDSLIIDEKGNIIEKSNGNEFHTFEVSSKYFNF